MVRQKPGSGGQAVSLYSSTVHTMLDALNEACLRSHNSPDTRLGTHVLLAVSKHSTVRGVPVQFLGVSVMLVLI